MTIPEITLKGSPQEMGLSFGIHFQNKIQVLAKKRFSSLNRFINEYCKKTIDKNMLFGLISSLLPYHEVYDEDLWSEFCGIAKGAKVSPEMLLVAMGFTDLRDYIANQLQRSLFQNYDTGECTSLIIPNGLSSQGVLYAQTWDMTPEVLDYLVVVHREPLHVPQTTYLTTVGGLGVIGLNSSGLAIGTTNLMSTDTVGGVIYLFTISKALKMDSITSAKNSILKTQKIAGHNFFIANSKEAVNIESTSRENSCTEINNYPYVHTNHYLTTSLMALEMKKAESDYAATCYRYSKMKENVSLANQDSWSADLCWELLGDDTKSEGGASICNENFENKDAPSATVASCVLIPEEKTMWVCAKGTKNGIKQTFSLK